MQPFVVVVLRVPVHRFLPFRHLVPSCNSAAGRLLGAGIATAPSHRSLVLTDDSNAANHILYS